jgi:hypothetical protein
MSALVALMMEAVDISETSVNFYYTTRRNIPEDSHIHILYVSGLYEFHAINISEKIKVRTFE